MMKQISFSKFVLLVCLISLMMILLTVKTFSQAFVNIEATTNGVGLSSGYSFNNGIEGRAGFNMYPSRRADKARIFYAAAGCKINLDNEDENNFSVTPLVGIADYRNTDFTLYNEGKADPLPVHKSPLFIGLELGKDFTIGDTGDRRGIYYLSLNRAEKYYGAIGLRIIID